MIWRPDLAAAAIVERDGRFLIVEERIRGQLVYNQPAGHVDDGESIIDACARETLEETGWQFTPRHLLGMYLWRNPDNGHSILRIAIIGDVSNHDPHRKLDEPIVATHWMTRDELLSRQSRLRSPFVMRTIDDYLAGRRHELSALAYLVTPQASLTA